MSMDDNRLVSAIDQVLGGEVSLALPTLENFAHTQPAWVTPIVALARAAEVIKDWESAFELWTQARKIAPQSDLVNDGVRRAALAMLNDCKPLPGQDVKHPDKRPDSIDVKLAHEPFDRTSDRKLEAAPDDDSDHDEKSTLELDAARKDTTSAPTPLIEPLDFDLTDLTAGAPALATGDSRNTLDDLDKLIDRLQGARIIPKEDASAIPAPDLDNDVDDIVSETLATIYLNQQQFAEAARVFDRLAEQQPDRADEFAKKAADARSKETE